jgi:hypothetical protein
MKISGNLGRMLALVVGLAVAAMVGAQTPAAAPAKPAPAKAAKPAKKAAQVEYRMVLEPKAMDLLKTMSAKLAAAKTLSFTAVVGYEYPSKVGPPIVFTTRYDVTMQRPDKLRVLMPGDGPASEFYYDGKAMMAYSPAENLVAISAAPPTVDAALQDAFSTAAIYFPFEDLVAADPYKALTDGAIVAFYVGPSGVVGGVKTDMVVWANPDVFLQIWIGVDDKLPRRIRAIFAADPRQLRHEMELSNWQLDPAVPAEAFVSAKAQAADRMPFASPTPKAPPGVKPIIKSKSAPPKAATTAPKAN